MIDILKSELPINEKNFWYNIGAILQKRIKGKIQILFNDIENSIVVKIFIEKFNYSICNAFPIWEHTEEHEVINMILDYIKYNIYEEIFK